MQKKQRRAQLLHAARGVFANKGYHAAKVGDIATAAGVAKGTVYLHFEDKRSIFAELIDALFLRLSAAILRVDVDGDVAAQIKHNIRAILGVLVDEPDTMRMLFAHANSLDAAFSAKIDSFYLGLKTMLAESLSDGQTSGLVRAGDPNLYASFTLGALKEILMEAASNPDSSPSREQIVEALFGLLCRGYLRVPDERLATPPTAQEPVAE